jgi:type I restriction enzyme R subunit
MAVGSCRIDGTSICTQLAASQCAEFPMRTGHGEADYLLFVDGMALEVVEAKAEGHTLTGVEIQTTKYSTGVPDAVPAPRRPLPFLYQSTGVEARFTSLLEPDARSCQFFAFHQPETLVGWLEEEIKHPGSSTPARQTTVQQQ